MKAHFPSRCYTIVPEAIILRKKCLGIQGVAASRIARNLRVDDDLLNRAADQPEHQRSPALVGMKRADVVPFRTLNVGLVAWLPAATA